MICVVIKMNVTIENDKIYVDKKPYFVKGVNYSPFGVGVTWRDPYPSEEIVKEDFMILKELGANAIRTYDMVPDYVFDLSEKFNLGLIDGVWIEQGNVDFSSSKVINQYEEHVKKHVSRDSNFKSLFMYLIGNEINPHLAKKHGTKFWEKFFKKMYDAANAVDADTPKSYAHFPLSGRYFASAMDVISLQVYPWEFIEDGNYRLGDEKLYKKYEKYIFDHKAFNKPIVVTEFGMHSKPPNDQSDEESILLGEKNQVKEVKIQFDILKKLDIAGLCVFEFSDEWWKDAWTPDPKKGSPDVHDFSDPEEFFGIVDTYRRKKPVFEVVKESFKSQT